MTWKLLFFWTFCLSSSLAQVNTIVCYLQGTSFHGSFSLENKKTNPCTHIIYSKATLNPLSGIVEIDGQHEDGLEQLLNYRENGGMDFKVMIQIGDAYDSDIYSSLTSSPASRNKLIYSIISLTNQYGFHGVDLHWMFPGSKVQEKRNYLSLGQELKRAFEEEASRTNSTPKLISMVLPTAVDYIKSGYYLIELQGRVVDFFCLPAFGFNSSDSPLEDHHSPISAVMTPKQGFTPQETSVEHIVRVYLRVGLLPRNLVLGMPLFGRKYVLSSDNSTVIENGQDFVPFHQICELREHGWTFWNNSLKGKFAYKDDQVISYDDEESIAEKVKLAIKFNLKGIMFWSMDMDDSSHRCPTYNEKYNNKGWLLIDSAAETWIQEQRMKVIAGYGLQSNNHSPTESWENSFDKQIFNRSVVRPNPVEDDAFSSFASIPVREATEEATALKPVQSVSPLAYPDLPASEPYVQNDSQSKETWENLFPANLLNGIKVIEAAKDIIIEDTQIYFNENNYYRSPPPRN